MGLMKSLDAKAGANARNGSGGKKSKNRAGILSATNLDIDMEKLVNDLTGPQLKRSVKKMNTVVRRSAVAKVRRASSHSNIGESMKSKMTRGDWKNPAVVKREGSAIGTNYLRGGWYGETLDKRGANKPSMANNGGEDGNTGIISKSDRLKRGRGYVGIIGPRYGDDAKDNSRHGYNYAHVLEKGGKHFSWKKPSEDLEARPFLGPAGKETYAEQVNILKNDLIKWGKS